jgi:hypothetical protein
MLTPRQHEHLVHLATCMPFERAAQMLAAILGVQVSEATVRRWTEQAGARYEAVQTAQSQQPEPETNPSPVPCKQAISSDGAYVPLVSGEWAEVRTAAIGEVETRTNAQGNEQVKVTHLSYFSRMTDAATFEQLAEVEVRRRNVRQAQAICAVTDGALWRPRLIDLHRPDAVRILDFPHAAEYVSAIGEAVRASGRHLPRHWLDGVLHRLKHEGPDRVLTHLGRLCERCKDWEMDKKLRYLSARRDLMGVTDLSASWVAHRLWHGGECQQVGDAKPARMGLGCGGLPRMSTRCWRSAPPSVMNAGRRPGTRSSPSSATTRPCVCSNERLRACSRCFPLYCSCSCSSILLPPSLLATPPRPVAPAATLPGSSRPSPHHIWKRTPACRPKLVAKN